MTLSQDQLFSLGVTFLVVLVFFAGLLLPKNHATLVFNGEDTQVTIFHQPEYSTPTTGELTVSAWMRPETLEFSKSEGSGYVYWLGKGEKDDFEWTFRMYSQSNTELRDNRISFYVFNKSGGLGVGAYFQEPVTPNEWIHVVATVDRSNVSIYKNGLWKNTQDHTQNVVLETGASPVRIGTRNERSFFKGNIKDVAIYNRKLRSDEVMRLFQQPENIPQNGLVGYWRLNEGIGFIANDSGSPQNSGTITNPTWIEP